MTGLSVAALLLAVAVLVRPGPAVVAARLTALRPPRLTHRVPPTTWVALAALALPALVGAGAVSLVLAVPVGIVLVRHRLPISRLRGIRRRARTHDPMRLASCWDLLAACLRGGLPVPLAVQAVTPQLPDRAADALRQTAELLALGADPVAAWAPALDEPLTAELARGARRSARSGAALAAVAEGLASRVRAGANDLAEARAQRVAVAVTGPLGLCFLPAFLCVGVVPVVIGLATRLMASW